MQQDKTAIVWFTNNLRVEDNEQLYRATTQFKHVIGVYCFNPKQFGETACGFKKTEKFRSQFLIETVSNLKANLEALNITLLVHHDAPEHVLPKLRSTYNADAILFQEEFTQEETDSIENVKKVLPKTVEVISDYSQFLFHPNDLPFSVYKIPRVFTDFRKKVEKYAEIRPLQQPIAMPVTNKVFDTTKLPTLNELGCTNFETHSHSAFPFKGGENAALKRLDDYFFKTKKLGVYKKTRNGLVGVDYSSKFSSWLANGSISAKTIYHKVKTYEAFHGSNQSTYWLIFELIWRDFFKYIALKHGNDLFKRTGILNKEYEWYNDKEKIAQWINGETLEPFVNANMIELKQTGWMSNRGRQNVASYFAKTLQLDWRIGAQYFESMLIDYDVHSNYGNWQYVSGVGNDPRNRVFNVQLQSERYDAKSTFRNLWLQPTLF